MPKQSSHCGLRACESSQNLDKKAISKGAAVMGICIDSLHVNSTSRLLGVGRGKGHVGGEQVLEVLCCRHGWWPERPGREEPGVSLERPEDQMSSQECCPPSPLGKKEGTRRLRAALLDASRGPVLGCSPRKEGGSWGVFLSKEPVLFKDMFSLTAWKKKSSPLKNQEICYLKNRKEHHGNINTQLCIYCG